MERHIEDLVANPHRHFDKPQDVLVAGDLSHDVKRRILESWQLDASRLAESTAENMSGGEESDLRDVSKALTHLKEMSTAEKPERQPRRWRRPGWMVSSAVGAVVGAAVGLMFVTTTGWAAVLLLETTIIGALIGGLASFVRRSVRA